ATEGCSMAGRSGSCRCTFDVCVFAAALAAGCQRAAPTPVVVPPPAASAAARTDGSDWSRFLGPFGTGISPETGIRTDWSRGLPLVWQLPVGEGYCAPVVAGGRVFHFDRVGAKARLTAYRPDTAAELWRFEYPTDYRDKYGYDGGPRACPVVDGDRVYIHGP